MTGELSWRLEGIGGAGWYFGGERSFFVRFGGS